jgi:hypothetical protein
MWKKYYSIAYFGILISLVFLNCGKDDNPVEPGHEEEHAEAVGCVVKQGEIELARAEKGVVTGSFQLEENIQSPLLNFYLIADDGDLFRPEDEEYSFAWQSMQSGIADAIQFQTDGPWNFHVKGLSAGSTTIVLKVLHGDHEDFVSLDIPIVVGAGSGGGL